MLRLVSAPVSLVNDTAICLCTVAREFMFFVLLTVVATSGTFLLEYIFDFARMALYLDLAEGSLCLLPRTPLNSLSDIYS